MWFGGIPDVVVGTLEISLDRLPFYKEQKGFSKISAVCHVAVSSE